jgi:membrane fusion protein (multidrug efflux system)
VTAPKHGERIPVASDDLGFALPAPAKPGAARIMALMLLAGALVSAAFLFGYVPRRHDREALAHTTRANVEQVPLVDVVHPKQADTTRPLSLPASLQPFAETVLYPRANGYVQRFDAEMGDRVTQGQLLAVIETPELDQQLAQARAQLMQVEAALGQAEAQRDYAQTSLDRLTRLRPAGVASQQELDQKAAEAKVSAANVIAATANVEVGRADIRRLEQLKSFARVSAPFAGIVTQRNIERGALVTAGNSTPLFRLAATDPMRVFVEVPQALAVRLKTGDKAHVRVREYPDRVFEGSVAHMAGALDPATRTMNAEIRLANPKNELLAGMYAQASLELEVARSVCEIPATALYNDAQGLRVASVDAQDKIHFKPIVLERDTGATLQIASGLQANDRIVKLADAALTEGAQVQVQVRP